MKPNTVFQKIDNLQIGSFIAKDGLGLGFLSAEVRISQIRKLLYPKEFKSVKGHLVRVK